MKFPEESNLLMNISEVVSELPIPKFKFGPGLKSTVPRKEPIVYIFPFKSVATEYPQSL